MHHVFTLHESQEGRERAPVLERGGEPPGIGGRVVQRQVLYLGEINGSQREAWRKTIEVFEEGAATAQTMALFPEDCPVEIDDESVVQIRLKEVELRRPRQWGACWLACQLYEQLGLDKFLGGEVAAEPQGDALGSDRSGA